MEHNAPETYQSMSTYLLGSCPPLKRGPTRWRLLAPWILCLARVIGSRQRTLKPCKPSLTLAPSLLARNIVCPHSSSPQPTRQRTTAQTHKRTHAPHHLAPYPPFANPFVVHDNINTRVAVSYIVATHAPSAACGTPHTACFVSSAARHLRPARPLQITQITHRCPTRALSIVTTSRRRTTLLE